MPTDTRSLPWVPHQPHVLTDSGSLGHLLIGWLAGQVPASQALVVFTFFTAYQVSQAGAGDEPLYRVGGELMEFALGMLIAQLMKGKT